MSLLKRIFDFIIVILILPFFIVIHLILIILIQLTFKRSVFFIQKRLGKDKKEFNFYKYRTMYENGDLILKSYLKDHPEEIEYYEKYHKYKNDPRITKIGKFLRVTSLDELPQIINVLKGDMSFVGPRPYLPEELKKMKGYEEIFQIKPGITGLWQVSGRNNLTFQERLDLEKYYVEHWSLWLDFVIWIKTIKVVLFKIGAK